METKHFRLECGAKEQDTYVFSVKIPPRSELVEQMDKQRTKATTADIGFSTGILYNIQHSVKLIFAKPGQLSRKAESPKPINPYEYQPMQGFSGSISDTQPLDIYVFVCFYPKLDEEVVVSSIKIRFLSESDGLDLFTVEKEIKPMGPATKECEYEFDIQKYQNFKYWLWSGDHFENSSLWTEKVTELRFTMNVIRKEFKPLKFRSESTEQDYLLPTRTHEGMLDTSHLFLSEQFSDVKLLCKGVEFPAHRIVLSARSKYFENLFLSSLDNIANGVIEVMECEPPILKEVLRFMYVGEVDNFDENVRMLFHIADKYLVDELHLMCEKHYVRMASLENATEMYSIGTKCNGKLLAKMAKRLILSNRDKFIADPVSFKNFTAQHPELMFELFHVATVTDLNLLKK